MILEEQIKTVIAEQKKARKMQNFIERHVKPERTGERILVLSGVRRCGKSTLLQQSIGNSEKSITLNFEDPRLVGFTVSDFYKIEKIAADSGADCFIFDEIQNIQEWEKYARAAHESGKKLYITGSNASLLSKELGTRLTGRYLQIELFPFDFFEYLNFKTEIASENTFKDYLISGGFPEFIKEQNPEYLRTLLKDIVVRDIAVRRNIRNEQTLVQLAVFLMTNIAKEFSYNNITKILQIKSVRSTIDYCDYLQESYLVEFVPRFSYSVKQQIGNPKKVYAVDTGMAKANSLSFSDDWGRLLENAVYLQLRQYFREIQYFKGDKTECDFIVKNADNQIIAIQVCWHLTPDNLDRELNGLKNAIETTKAKRGLLLTFNQEDTFDDISVIPVWKYRCAEFD